MTDAQLRNQVSINAASDPEKALALARRITVWEYRRAALIEVAQYVPENQVRPITDELLKLARYPGDTFKTLAASTPALGLLARRGKVQLARDLLTNLLIQVDSLEKIVNRSDFLMSIWPVLPLLGSVAAASVTTRLAEYASQESSWKCAKNLAYVIAIVALTDEQEALKLANSMRESKFKRITLRDLQARRITIENGES